MSRTPIVLPIALALVLLAPACPHEGGGGGDGGQSAGDGGGLDGSSGDGGSVDAGPGPCFSDWECGATEICDSGKCVAGTACDPKLGFANCNYPAPGAGCGGSDIEACVCDPAGQVCKERRILCEPCTADEECGSYPAYERPAKCVDLAGEKVCLQVAGARACPQGYIAQDGYCVPASGDCASVFACTQDSDCPPSRPVCNLSNGTCAKGCIFDLETGASTCASNLVCHQDGRCRNPCDPNNDTCSDIDPDYVCKQDTGGVYRCRYAGCIDDIECEVPADQPYVGFCDLSNHACVLDRCRPERTQADGTNPDCKLPNRCNDQGQCVPMTCVERGGAALACMPNGICCGECRNILNRQNRDACDPWLCNGSETPQQGGLEGCVDAPNPPWCQACSQASDCTMTNPTEDVRDKNQCFNKVCSPTCDTSADCPRLWECRYIYAGCDPTQANQCGANGTCVDDGSWGAQCTNDNDCNTNANESCVPDDQGVNRCHAAFNVCDCGGSGAVNDGDCPTDTRCAEVGFQKMRCVTSKVCLPGQGLCQ